ncbi:36195_t:CDS:1 [Gigaspora margarita]|uniref:36195_t:CDS:1 n=1 Tax=Gigaspora margarita TaxID=4874 RepID=A0ABN7UTW3_GIGMA|nr:36195_t:CDS:1 [Gigaspora margarita]
MIRLWHDGNIHNPPGGASTIFNEGYANYIFNHIPKDDVRISVGAVPNSPPHFGTIITFSLAFSLAQRLEKLGKIVTVMVGMVDTIALGTDIYRFNDVEYQKSIAYTGIIHNYINDFKELLDKLNYYFGGVNYKLINQSELNLHRKAPEIITKLINEREKIGQSLFPSTKCLALRMTCPQCGLADIYGIKNCYNGNIISFFCPNHGRYSIDIEKDDLQTLQYETQLRSLVRGLLYTEDNKDKDVPYSWLRVTGGDFAGFYQEQLFYRVVAMMGIDIVNSPLIVYSPLVIDWAGVKLSKSILVKGGYKYLTEQGLDYFIHYRKFKEMFDKKGLEILFDEVNLWLDEPHKLFRNYTIFYFDELLKTKIGSNVL